MFNFRFLASAALAGAVLLPATSLAQQDTFAARAEALGPSFDCDRAESQAELAICSDADLSRSDRLMASAYKGYLSSAPDPQAVRASQRVWLQRAASCGADVECLRSAYDDRLAEFQGSSLPNSEADSSPEGTTSPLPAGEETVLLDDAPASGGAASPTVQTSDETASEGPPAPKSRSIPLWRQTAFTAALLAVLFVVVASLLVTKKLAERTVSKYDWPMILNWWNVLYVVGAIGGGFWGAIQIANEEFPFIGLSFFLGIWAVMLVINIRKTSVRTGLAITLVQPFVLFFIFMGIQFARVLMQQPKPHRTS